jgi:NADH-quinone oxidoreductase subunit F
VARGEPYQHGEGRPEDRAAGLGIREHHRPHHLCTGDAAAMPVRAMIKHFRHEFEAIQNAPNGLHGA